MSHGIKVEVGLVTGDVSIQEFSKEEINDIRKDLAEEDYEALQHKPRKKILKELKKFISLNYENFTDQEIAEIACCDVAALVSDTTGQIELVGDLDDSDYI